MGETNVLSYVLADRSDASKYAQALLKTLGAVKRENQVTHYALTRILDVLASSDAVPGVSSPAALFFDEPEHPSMGRSTVFKDNFAPFQAALESRDDWTRRAAAVAAACVLAAAMHASPPATNAANKPALEALVSWACGQAQSGRAGLSCGVPALTVLAKSEQARLSLGAAGAIGFLARHLALSSPAPAAAAAGLSLSDKSASPALPAQTLYEVTFSLWTLSFAPELRGDFASHGVAGVLAGLVAGAPREKVTRVALAALRNLASEPAVDEDKPAPVAAGVFVVEMLHAGFLKTLAQLKERQWSDPDVEEDVEALATVLGDNFKEFSTWEK
jgi:hypothetical protein